MTLWRDPDFSAQKGVTCLFPELSGIATGDALRDPASSGSQRRRAALLKIILLGMFCWPVQAGMDFGFP
jgi:hypothetical protein